jgi:hypothetical protein
MAKQTIDLGIQPNDGTGDSLRVAGAKINDNFDELYGRTQGLEFTANSLSISSNTGSSFNTNTGGSGANQTIINGSPADSTGGGAGGTITQSGGDAGNSSSKTGGTGAEQTIEGGEIPTANSGGTGGDLIQAGGSGGDTGAGGEGGTGAEQVIGGGSGASGDTGGAGGNASQTGGSGGEGSGQSGGSGGQVITDGGQGGSSAGPGAGGGVDISGGDSGSGEEGGKISVPGGGTNDPLTIQNPQGPIEIGGDPETNQPGIRIPSPSSNGDIEIRTGFEPWQVLYTDEDGKVTSSPYIKVSSDESDPEGKSLHLSVTRYDLGFGGNKDQGSIYFVDENYPENLLEAWPSKRVASISYVKEPIGGSGVQISPWENYNDGPFTGEPGLTVWRWQEQSGVPRTKVTLGGGDGTPTHRVAISHGALQFRQYLASGDANGQSYIIMQAVPDASGPYYIGQISSKPYNESGVPYFSLGWKQTYGLIENVPGGSTAALEKYEQIPGSECITWDVNCRVTLGSGNNNIEIPPPNSDEPIRIGTPEAGLKIPQPGSQEPSEFKAPSGESSGDTPGGQGAEDVLNNGESATPTSAGSGGDATEKGGDGGDFGSNTGGTGGKQSAGGGEGGDESGAGDGGDSSQKGGTGGDTGGAGTGGEGGEQKSEGGEAASGDTGGTGGDSSQKGGTGGEGSGGSGGTGAEQTSGGGDPGTEEGAGNGGDSSQNGGTGGNTGGAGTGGEGASEGLEGGEAASGDNGGTGGDSSQKGGTGGSGSGGTGGTGGEQSLGGGDPGTDSGAGDGGDATQKGGTGGDTGGAGTGGSGGEQSSGGGEAASGDNGGGGGDATQKGGEGGSSGDNAGGAGGQVKTDGGDAGTPESPGNGGGVGIEGGDSGSGEKGGKISVPGGGTDDPLTIENPNGPIAIGNSACANIVVPNCESGNTIKIVTGFEDYRVVYTQPENGELTVSNNFTYDDQTLVLKVPGEFSNIRIENATISSLNVDENITLSANGTGLIDVSNTRIINVEDPINAKDAVNKRYVDEVAEGLKPRPAVYAATTENLDGTYSNTTSTLTSTTNGAFPTIDGVTPSEVGQGILLKDQTNKLENGRYVLTTVGDNETPWELTRCGLCDESDEIPASYVFVQEGTQNKGTGWVFIVEDTDTFQIHVDDIIVTQFTGAADLMAGDGIIIANNTITNNGVLSVNGVTGNVTSNNLLDAIKTVDGSGSGLDADTLDGYDSSYFLDWNNSSNKPSPKITINLENNLTGSGNTTLTELSNGTINISATYIDTVYTGGNTGSSLTPNRNNGTVQKYIANQNFDLNAPTNMSVGHNLTLIITQDSVGLREMTANSEYKFASGLKTLSTSNNAIDMLNIFYDGTYYYVTLTTGYA